MSKRTDLKERLIIKIHRMQKRGENADGQIRALAELLKGEQHRSLRQRSNARFGRKKARELRRIGGELAFDFSPPTTQTGSHE